MGGDEATRRRPFVVAVPRDDPSFAAAIERALAAGAATAAALQAALRREYPRTIARERALSGELEQVWYAYRDGRWVRSGQEGGS